MVQETLDEVERDLPSHCELLWDRIPQKHDSAGENRWMPKPEAALSAYLAHDLILRLHGRGLAVNREVLVRPTDDFGAGDRTDILIESTLRPRHHMSLEPTRLALVIEVKGLWNAGLMESQTTQLADRYLKEAEAGAGIYVIGWYPTDGWTVETDWRLAKAKKLDYEDVMRTLRAQAEEISTTRNVVVLSRSIRVDRALPTSG